MISRVHPVPFQQLELLPPALVRSPVSGGRDVPRGPPRGQRAPRGGSHRPGRREAGALGAWVWHQCVCVWQRRDE